MYGASPCCLFACWRTAFFAGAARGTESSASLLVVVDACAGDCAGLEDENLEERLDSQEPRLCGGVPGLLAPFFSEEPVLMGIGRLGVLLLPLLVMGAGIWLGLDPVVEGCAVGVWPLEGSGGGDDATGERVAGSRGDCRACEGAVFRRWLGFAAMRISC